MNGSSMLQRFAAKRAPATMRFPYRLRSEAANVCMCNNLGAPWPHERTLCELAFSVSFNLEVRRNLRQVLLGILVGLVVRAFHAFFLWWFYRRMGRKSVASKSPTRLRTTQHAGLTHDLHGRLMAALGVASRSLPLDRLRQSGQQRDAQRRRAEAQRDLMLVESVDQFFVCMNLACARQVVLLSF